MTIEHSPIELICGTIPTVTRRSLARRVGSASNFLDSKIRSIRLWSTSHITTDQTDAFVIFLELTERLLVCPEFKKSILNHNQSQNYNYNQHRIMSLMSHITKILWRIITQRFGKIIQPEIRVETVWNCTWQRYNKCRIFVKNYKWTFIGSK